MKLTSKDKALRFIALGIAAALITLLTQGCAPISQRDSFNSIGTPNPPEALPPEPEGTYQGGDSTAVVTVTRNGREIDVRNARGEVFVPCFLCPPEYVHRHPEDPHCQNLKKKIDNLSQEKSTQMPNICGGLTAASTNSILPIIVMATHKNPDCTFVQAYGSDTAIRNSASHQALKQFMQILGIPAEDIDYILADPKANCLH